MIRDFVVDLSTIFSNDRLIDDIQLFLCLFGRINDCCDFVCLQVVF